MTNHNRQYLLERLPEGRLTPDCFRLVETDLPVPKDGEVLVKVHTLGIDAAARAWMNGATYRDALKKGTLMAGRAVADVVESRHSGFAPGDRVFAETGWQDYAAIAGDALTMLPLDIPVSQLLSIFGVSGLTAYFGLTEVARAGAGDTVVISAAAGAVGNIVGQIAKILGCRVVGVAGTDDKCNYLTGQLGFDAAINYRSDDVPGRLKALCPRGIDVYFDNVGGELLAAAIEQMNINGRIACCGAVANYDSGSAPTAGPAGVPLQLVIKRLTLRGFIVSDFFDRRTEALEQLRTWLDEGRLQPVVDMLEGFEQLPAALVGLLQGCNVGKRMVRIN